MDEKRTASPDIDERPAETPRARDESQVVAALAWADAVERLDILILEIRHIQSNIAQLLRKPRLLNLLRYEEIFIWGTVGDDRKTGMLKGQALPDWIDLFGKLDNAPGCLPELSSFFVLPINDRLKSTAGKGFEDTPLLKDYHKQREELIERVSTDVADSLYSAKQDGSRYRAQWGQEHRRNYHLFRALQRLKRNLVLAKLQLCWWGGVGLPTSRWRRRTRGRVEAACTLHRGARRRDGQAWRSGCPAR